MKLSFKAFIGSVPTTLRTEVDVTVAGVWIKKEDQIKLRTSKKLKLSKVAREGGGGNDKFVFFEVNGKMVNKFQTVYDLHMRIEALAQALNFYDMCDIFQVIPENTVELLEVQLANLFTRQEVLDRATDEL